MNHKQTTAREPQTAAYQAAVDNVADHIERFADWQQKRWNFLNRWDRLERDDYVANLKMEIEKVVRPIQYR